MRLEQVFFAILTFSIFVTAGGLVWSNLASNYDITVEDNGYFDDSYDVINEVYLGSNTTKNDVVDTDIEGGEATADSMIQGGFTAVRKISSPITIANNIISNLATALGIPSFVTTTVLVSLLISVVFGLIYMVFRFKPMD